MTGMAEAAATNSRRPVRCHPSPSSRCRSIAEEMHHMLAHEQRLEQNEPFVALERRAGLGQVPVADIR